MTRQPAPILLVFTIMLVIASYFTCLIKIDLFENSIHAQETTQRKSLQESGEPNRQIIEALGYIPKEGADLSRVTTQISQSF